MATVRMTGLISNMDTETIIQGMLDAQKLKNKKVTDKQTKLTWQQEKWKELNAKLYKLYTEDLTKMKLQGSYQTKSVSSSNEALATVTGAVNSPVGAHSLSIDTLASSQYVTSGKLANTVTTSTTLKELQMVDSSQLVIKLKNGDTEKNLVVSDTTTLGDFISACKEIGLNASYDTTQQRLFISSKSSGDVNKFSITTGEMSTGGLTAFNNVKDLVNYTGIDSAGQSEVTAALNTLEGKTITDELYNTVMTADPKTPIVGSTPEEQTVIDALTTLRDYAITRAEASVKSAATQDIKDDIKASLSIDADPDQLAIIDSLVESEYNSTETTLDAGGNSITKAALYQSKVNEIYNVNVDSYRTTALIGTNGLVKQVKDYILGASDSTGISKLTKMGLDKIDGTAVPTTTSDKLTVVAATDATITLDGATLSSSTNTIIANGLTITAKGVTSTSGPLSLNVSDNTQANYDMVKSFITSYNSILKEMNSLYYADSSRGYDPLSDDEKEAMTDSEIEKWETKIKDSILRRDSTLGSLITAMKTSMSSTVTVGGNKYSLSNYGIGTSSDYSEKGLLHIDGNKDDSAYMNENDKLMKALQEDPDTVMKVLSGISKDLYDTMDEKMDSIPNVRSAFTFYNDKTMATQQTAYKKQVSILEDKLVDLENKYYKQFSAMESALAKLQSQSNSLAGMLGTSS